MDKENKKEINIEELKKQKDEYLEGWKKERAGFLNYKKEEMERIEELMKYANVELIMKFFPILDNLDIAEKNLSEDLKNDKSVQGILQIKTQILDFLKSQGVEPIKSIGEKFDANLHEAVGETETEEKDSGVIFEEIQNKDAETSFYVSEDELTDLKSARFDYFVFCSSSERVKQLSIFANEGLISSGTPVCDQFSSVSIPEEYLKKGTNLLKFKMDEGDLIIERGEVGLELKSKKQLTYTFTLKGDDYWDVFDDRSMVFLTLAFSEISKNSYVDVFVNGNLINVGVDDGVYRDDISNFIKEGKNVLMLIPSGNFEIESLVVSLE